MVSMRRRLRGLTTKATPPVSAPEPVVEAPDAVVDDTVEVPVTVEDPAIAPDPTCAAAVELARAVAVEAGGTSVGDHLGAEFEDDLVVTHSFATTDPAYVGWRWVVTVTRADGSDEVTVDDVVLLPGGGALLAPAWVPWSERVQAGDLSPGDLLPPAVDDPRLVPSYTETEVELAADAFWELGLGRPRVLSWEGRVDTADRWYDGEHGPSAAMARQAPGQCLDCAFRLPLAGSLGALFGVCANAFAPADGNVVSLDHGCGAHSETTPVLTHVSGTGLVVEDEQLEMVATGQSPEEETPDGHAS